MFKSHIIIFAIVLIINLIRAVAYADEEIAVIPQGAYGFISVSGKAAEQLYNEVLGYVYEVDQDGVFYKNAEHIQCYKIPDDSEPTMYGCNIGFTNDGKALQLEDFLN